MTIPFFHRQIFLKPKLETYVHKNVLLVSRGVIPTSSSWWGPYIYIIFINCVAVAFILSEIFQQSHMAWNVTTVTLIDTYTCHFCSFLHWAASKITLASFFVIKQSWQYTHFNHQISLYTSRVENNLLKTNWIKVIVVTFILSHHQQIVDRFISRVQSSCWNFRAFQEGHPSCQD